MKDKIFLDTNFLVYLQNHNEPKKQVHCRALLSSFQDNSAFVISTQVLQEFYIVMTRNLAMDPVQVKSVIRLFRQFEVVLIDPDSISNAIDLSILNQTSFWDALIITAAQKANCSSVLTEDLNDGQTIGGVRILNPFKISIP